MTTVVNSSVSTLPVSNVSISPPALSNKRPVGATVRLGPRNVTHRKFTADIAVGGQTQTTIQLDAGVLLKRVAYYHYYLLVGRAGPIVRFGANSVSTADGSFNQGNDNNFQLTAQPNFLPLQSSMITQTVSVNNVPIVDDIVSRLMTTKRFMNNVRMDGKLDGIGANPDFIDFDNGKWTTIQNAGNLMLGSVYIRELLTCDTLKAQATQAAGTPWGVTNAYRLIEIYEPVLAPPFLFTDEADVEPAMSNVRNMTFQINMASKLVRSAWTPIACKDGSGNELAPVVAVLHPNTDYSGNLSSLPMGNSTSIEIILTQYTEETVMMALPSVNVYPIAALNTLIQTVTPTATQTLYLTTTQQMTLTSQPNRLFIGIMPQDPTTGNTGYDPSLTMEDCATITSVSITYGNRTGLLADMTPADLHRMSMKNGLRSSAITMGSFGSTKPTLTGRSNGNVLCIDPTTDFGSDGTTIAPGMGTQINLQATIGFVITPRQANVFGGKAWVLRMCASESHVLHVALAGVSVLKSPLSATQVVSEVSKILDGSSKPPGGDNFHSHSGLHGLHQGGGGVGGGKIWDAIKHGVSKAWHWITDHGQEILQTAATVGPMLLGAGAGGGGPHFPMKGLIQPRDEGLPTGIKRSRAF